MLGNFGGDRFADEQAQNVGLLGEVRGTRAITNGGNAHRRDFSVRRRKRSGYGRASGSDQFFLDTAGKCWSAAKEFGSCGRGNGKKAMLGLHAAAANVHRGAGELLDAEKVEADGCADDVDNGIHSAHFVEMNFFDGNVVDFSFGFAKAAEDFGGVFGGARSESSLVDHFQNVGKMTMMVLLTDFDGDLGGMNGLARDFLRGNFPGIEAELAEFGFETREFEAGVDESAEHHVSADAGKTIEVNKFHFFVFGEPGCASRAERQTVRS